MNSGQNIFKDLPFCTVQDLSPRYLYALANSKTAVIYGGYNSIIDILSVNIPAVVLLRKIDDMEQEEHVKKISDVTNTSLLSISEHDVDSRRLHKALQKQLQVSTLGNSGLNLDGAATAAQKVAEYIRG
jgi:predicted glycosyltransferase